MLVTVFVARTAQFVLSSRPLTGPASAPLRMAAKIGKGKLGLRERTHFCSVQITVACSSHVGASRKPTCSVEDTAGSPDPSPGTFDGCGKRRETKRFSVRARNNGPKLIYPASQIYSSEAWAEQRIYLCDLVIEFGSCSLLRWQHKAFFELQHKQLLITTRVPQLTSWRTDCIYSQPSSSRDAVTCKSVEVPGK